MTKDELIVRLQSDLQNVMGWAAELSDEYLDGDPDTRKAFSDDMESARESSLCQLARSQECDQLRQQLSECQTAKSDISQLCASYKQQLADVQAEDEYKTFFYAVADQWVSMYFADGDICEGCNYFVPGPGGPDPTYCKCLDGGDPSECPAFENYFDEIMRPYK